MTETNLANRRTVLKAITTATVAGGVASGTAVGSRRSGSGHARGRRNVLEFTAGHDHAAGTHYFDLDRSEVASGWTTLEFDNQSEHTHFSYLAKLPRAALRDAEKYDMTPLEFYVETVTKPFQWFLDAVYVPSKDPDPSDDTDVYDTLFPPWFGDVTYHGGVGLTDAGTASSTTVNLDPGTYTMECYVKNDENDFHSYSGMIEQIDVTDGDSGAPEPEATLDVSVSASGGIEVGSGLRPGLHTVGVTFEDQKVYSNLVGHDVHLVRLDGGTTVEDVNGWMNWADPDQLIAEGNEPTTFLGGVQDILPADSRAAYFDVRLEPGDYALVAEVPDPRSKGLLREFSVPPQRS